MHAEVLNVYVAAQASVEEQVLAGVMVVVVDVDLVAVPLPIAAVIDLIRGNHRSRNCRTRRCAGCEDQNGARGRLGKCRFGQVFARGNVLILFRQAYNPRHLEAFSC